MKQFIFALLIIFSFTACEKDIPIEDTTISGKKPLIVGNYVSKHENMAKVFSVMAANQKFRNLVIDEINNSTTKDNHSVSFLEILNGNKANKFAEIFKNTTTNSNSISATSLPSNVNFNNFINSYLTEHPNLCISIFYPDSPTNTNLQYINNQIPVFSELVYDNANNSNVYEFFKNGAKDPSLTQSSSPEMTVLVLQEREGFTSLDKDLMTDETYFNKYSKVYHSQYLIDNTDWNDINFNSTDNAQYISIGGTNYQNPFYNLYYITDEDITNVYNVSGGSGGGTVFPPPPPPPPASTNFICDDGSPAPRTTFNNSINEEVSNSIKLPAGNDLLELNNDWCAWWNRNCRFQIDLFHPSSSLNSETFEYIQTTKFAWYNERDLKKKIFVEPESDLKFHPWKYESGIHGDEWRYMWTGKHRKEGNESTFGVTASLSPTIKFKIIGISVELKSLKLGANYSIKRTNKDLFVGDDLVYWCDDNGYQYSTGDVEFFIEEE